MRILPQFSRRAEPRPRHLAATMARVPLRIVMRRSIVAVGAVALLLLGCRAEVMKVPDPVVEHSHISVAACFACRDRETLTQALELRKSDREAFARLRTSGKIVPVGRGERVKLLATAENGKYAKIRLKKDPNDFWTLTEWLKPYDPDKDGPKAR